MLEAAVVSNAHSPVGKVFLMIQKDEPGLTHDALWPVNNHDIDTFWVTSFSFLENLEPYDAIIVLKDQIDAQKNPVRWRPLFYCIKTGAFFHPSCPTCGFPLDMCTDDDLLIQAGLQPYTTSLKRYLYCPRCLSTGGESAFYVPSRNLSDPEIVKDREDIIRGFGTHDLDRDPAGNLPCPGCPEHEVCYGSSDQALSRIVSLSFYPFYLLVHPAPTLHLLDFLPLISGAGFEDQKKTLKAGGQKGRCIYLTDFEQECSRRALFFFDQNDRFFPEVLYLKLSLLGEMARIVSDGLEKMRYPDLGLSLERFWVRVAEQNPLLPRFWNFTLRPLGVAFDHVEGPCLPKLPPNFGLYFLGFMWFYVLLRNRRSPVTEINERVAEAFEERSSDGDDALHVPLIEDLTGVFAPENIFWDPENKTVPPVWRTLWSNTLDMGFRLLADSRRDPSRWSQKSFENELDNLRANVREALFLPETFQDTQAPATDRDICSMLSEIYEKWRSAEPPLLSHEETPRVQVSSADKDVMDDIVQETVTLKPGEFTNEAVVQKGAEKEIKPPEKPPQGVASPKSETTKKDDLPETVIVTPGSLKEDESQGQEPGDQDIPETIIVSAERVSRARADAECPQPAEQGSTGVPEKDASNEEALSDRIPEDDKAETDPDAVPETIIIKAGKNGKP